MEEKINIRFFKVVSSINGYTYFEMKKTDNRGSVSFGDIETGVSLVKREVIEALETKSMVTIDFLPFHEIECPGNLAPRRCLPLSEEEKEEFWQCFVKEILQMAND